jgi:hypothetical protein
MAILLNCGLSIDQQIAVCQTIIGFLQFLAIIFIGILTVKTYNKITAVSADATRQAAKLSAESNLFNKLNQDLDRIVEFTIQYPYFEDEDYTKNRYRDEINSKDAVKRESAIRYELFAIMNFNFVEDLFKFYDGDESKMSKLAYYTELIESNGEYWKYKIIESGEGGYELIKPLVNRILKISPSK